jgi:vacuolar-type H+-ATPase subunit D/Vma8
MDLETLREWLIQNGLNAEELDEVKPPPALDDMANALVIALQNDDQLGELLVMLLSEIESLKQRVEALENA